MKLLHTICFEGIDGSGKETQSKLLQEYFVRNNRKSLLITFPDYSTMLGRVIKDALQDSTFDPYALQMLFSADRFRQVPKLLINTESKMEYVILDRYKWSSLVYGTARGLNQSWVHNLESILPNPDYTFYIDIPVEVSVQRTHGNDILEKDTELLDRCRNKYMELAQTVPNWHVLNGVSSKETIHKSVIDIINAIY